MCSTGLHGYTVSEFHTSKDSAPWVFVGQLTYLAGKGGHPIKDKQLLVLQQHLEMEINNNEVGYTCSSWQYTN